MKTAIVLLTLCGALSGQRVISPPDSLSPELIAFLELNGEQAEKIRASNRRLQEQLLEQQLRTSFLWFEAAEELKKPAPDAAVVGSRYAEMETICRAQGTAAKRAREESLTVLTEAQRRRLATLEEASRLMAVVNEARQANVYRLPNVPQFDSILLGSMPVPTAPSGFPGGSPWMLVPSRCASPFVRFGDFVLP